MTPINITSFEQGTWTSRMITPGDELTFPRENCDVKLLYHETPWQLDDDIRPSLTLRTVARSADVFAHSRGRARGNEAGQ